MPQSWCKRVQRVRSPTTPQPCCCAALCHKAAARTATTPCASSRAARGQCSGCAGCVAHCAPTVPGYISNDSEPDCREGVACSDTASAGGRSRQPQTAACVARRERRDSAPSARSVPSRRDVAPCTQTRTPAQPDRSTRLINRMKRLADALKDQSQQWEFEQDLVERVLDLAAVSLLGVQDLGKPSLEPGASYSRCRRPGARRPTTPRPATVSHPIP